MFFRLIAFITPAVFFFIMAVLPVSAYADAASIRAGEGGMIVTASNPDIRMVAEVIDIDVHQRFSEFDIVYTFRNTSNRKVSALMGFPEFFGSGPDKQLHGFQSFDGKRPLETMKYRGKDAPLPKEVKHGSAMFVFSVDFKPGEAKRIRNTYWIYNTEYKFQYNFTYILETGATWAGPIGQVDIHAQFDPGLVVARQALAADGPLITPAGYRLDRKKNTLSWHFENLEPTEEHNLLVRFERTGWPAYVDPQACSSVYRPEEEDYDCGDYHPFNLMDGDTGTGWAEGVEGPGIGEWTEIDMHWTQGRVNRVGVFNGLWKDGEYTKHPRLKAADIVFSNGKRYRIELDDYPRMQYFDLPPTRTESVRLVIKEVYDAAWPMPPWSDITVISELEVHMEE